VNPPRKFLNRLPSPPHSHFMDIYKLLGLPELASKHGADVDKLIVYVHYLMIVLFIGWTGYFVYTLWRFRQGRNPKADYAGVTSHASNYLEVAVAAIEIVLLVGFAVPLWARVVDVFPAEDKSQLVRVIGQQFNWTARYPGPDGKFGKQDVNLVSATNVFGLYQLDGKLKDQDPDGKDDVTAGGNEMAVPVRTNVITYVTSMDVIHSFKVIPLRVTQDAIPGIRIPIHFFATHTNAYQINCAQLCGNGHSSMKGVIRVLEQPDFDAWLKKKGAAVVNFE
jgi:cytochrome c oxidase subunit 2